MRGLLLVLTLLLAVPLCFPRPASAQLADRLRELEETRRQIATSKAQNEKLSRNISRIERDMESLANEVTDVAAQVQAYERDLTGIEEKLALLERQRTERKDALKARRQQLAAALSTLIRLEQAPQQSAMLMPTNFIGKVRATRTLSLTSRGLRLEMDSLGLQLAELRRLETAIAQRREDIATKAQNLHARQEELRRAVGARQRMMASLSTENRQQQEAITALIGRSEDLQSLVVGLEKARHEQVDEQFAHIGLPQPKPQPPSAEDVRVAHSGTEMKTAPAKATGLPAFGAAQGRLRMPAGGKVIGGFGERRGVNDTLKGVEIATRQGAQVVAPFAGEVLFTGPFRDYGNMVILRHSDNYHTLLAGLSELDCVPGQQVREGEPLGLMGGTIEATRLYLELRHEGKPTDPKPWIAGYGTYLAKK